MEKCKVIVNADDFGMSKSVNQAILDAFNKNLISSTTIMANMSGFEDAVHIINKHNLNPRVGIHINISEGQPLTNEIRKYNYFCDEEGFFLSRKYNIKQFLKIPSREEMRVLKLEIDAQIRKCRKYGLQLTHMDSHHHQHIELQMLWLLKDIAKEHNITNIRLARISDNKKFTGKYFYRKFANAYLKTIMGQPKVDQFIAFRDIEGLKKNNYTVLELMCHPVYKEGQIFDNEKTLDSRVKKLKEELEFSMISYSELI